MQFGEGAAARFCPIPPDPARSRPILARTLRNAVWTGVLANEGCSPIPSGPARSRTKKNGRAHPRNKKKLPTAPLLVYFLREVVISVTLCVFGSFAVLEVTWLELKYTTNLLTLTITRWESSLSNSTFIPAWWAVTTAFKPFGLPSLCCGTAA